MNRPIILVHGKGGVGKSAVSEAIAHALVKQGHRTLWITLEDPTRMGGETVMLKPGLWHTNIEFMKSFEQYIELKLGMARLARIFLQNKLIQFLARAAPGIHELVLLGKVWFERSNYDRVVVDMPSTGYALAMFQSTRNFTRLFQTGPLFKDAQGMLLTFADPHTTGHVILALPEEMPLLEALEFHAKLSQILPGNRSHFIANRVFPGISSQQSDEIPLYSTTASEYIRERIQLEDANLKLWREKKISFHKLPFVPPGLEESSSEVPENLSNHILPFLKASS